MSSTLATTLTIAAIAAGVAGTGTAIYEGDKSRDASAAATASNAALVKQQQQTTANQANLVIAYSELKGLNLLKTFLRKAS